MCHGRNKFFCLGGSLFRDLPKDSDKNQICCRKCQKLYEILENMQIMKRTLCLKMHKYHRCKLIKMKEAVTG
jgi:hypothetical protein